MDSWYRSPGLLIVTVILIVISGCGSLRIDHSLPESPDNWLLAGGNHSRTNYTPADASPPFTRAWSYSTGGGFGQTAAVIAGDFLIVGTLHGEVHMIHLPSGERVGYRKVDGPVSHAPLVYRNTLIIPVSSGNNSLDAYDLRTGKFIWRLRLGAIESAPLLYNGTIYTSSIEGTVYAIEPEEGEILWDYKIGERLYSSPAASSSLIFIGSSDGHIYALDAQTGMQRWKSEAFGVIMEQPATDGKYVFLTARDSLIAAVDAGTGATVWQTRLGARIYSPPSIGRNNVYVGFSDGTVFCLRKDTGDPVWHFKSESVISGQIIVSDKYIYVASLDSYVYILDARTGRQIWSQSLGTRIKTAPVVWKEYMFILPDDRNLYAFRSDASLIP